MRLHESGCPRSCARYFPPSVAARIRPRLHDPRIERPGTSRSASSEREAAHPGVHENVRFMQGQAEQRKHALRSHSEAIVFLRLQRDGRNPARFSASPPAKLRHEMSRAIANDYLRQIRQRREVAGSATEPCRRITGCTLAFNIWQSRIDHAAAARRSIPSPARSHAQHHRAGLRFTQRRPQAASVKIVPIHLKLPHLFRRDAHRSEFPEVPVLIP